MQLSTLLQAYFSLPFEADRHIAHLALDSRKIQKDSLFFAIQGTKLKGQEFIDQAIEGGASAILTEAHEANLTWIGDIPVISIPKLSKQLGFIAAQFYNQPAKKLNMIGVTGTSGKTSCTHFIAQALHDLYRTCGLIGTLGSGLYGALGEAGLTTPDAITLQALLQEFVVKKAQTVAMEVSSHSIHQGRINAIPFEVGIFTNLSQDHLDYHGDMATYANVKRRFIADYPIQHVVINADDEQGKTWLSELNHPSMFAYSTRKASQFAPTVYTENTQFSLEGIHTTLHSPWGNGDIFLPLIGEFNLSNALAVFTTLCLLGIPFEVIKAQLAKLHPVPGRMQLIKMPGKPLVVVDYAHKPDALEKVLQALRSHTQGKIICVFGCGGERDQGKRPLMAKIAEQLADKVIVTNDNPRHEDPNAIVKQILQGFSHPTQVEVEFERSKAIMKSIQWAGANDCILIAGKGAEHYQQIGDKKIPFDDVTEVKTYLEMVPTI